jgi:hypothetical protein
LATTAEVHRTRSDRPRPVTVSSSSMTTKETVSPDTDSGVHLKVSPTRSGFVE